MRPARTLDVLTMVDDDLDALTADLALELVRGAPGDDLAVVDHGDGVGQLVGFLQVLGGQQQARRRDRRTGNSSTYCLLLTTQYLEEADELANTIAVVDHGKIIARGTADELKSQVGGERIEVVVHHREDIERAAGLIRPFGVGDASSTPTRAS